MQINFVFPNELEAKTKVSEDGRKLTLEPQLTPSLVGGVNPLGYFQLLDDDGQATLYQFQLKGKDTLQLRRASAEVPRARTT